MFGWGGGAAVQGDAAFIFDGKVVGRGPLEAGEEAVCDGGGGGGGRYTVILTPQGRLFFPSPWLLEG